MAQDTYYIDLTDISTPTFTPINFQNTLAAFLTVQNAEHYHAFLYNPKDSNKILKIKNYDYKLQSGQPAASDYLNYAIVRTNTTLQTGSIESIQKLDTNSPDCPSGVGLTLNTSGSSDGTFRRSPIVYRYLGANNQFQHGTFGNTIKNLNTTVFYSAQNLGTAVQDITLAPGEELLITIQTPAAGGASTAATNFLISALFSSGSNTYFTSATTDTARFSYGFDSAANANKRLLYPGAFVNNSSTTIKVHRIELNFPHRDYGTITPGFLTLGGATSKRTIVKHVPSEQINIEEQVLANADTHSIISLDNTTTLPAGTKCFKNCIRPAEIAGTEYESAFTAGPAFIRYGKETFPALGSTGLSSLSATNLSYPIGLTRLHAHSMASKNKIDHSSNGREIIIRPGEGLGLMIHQNSTSVDNSDGSIMGYVTFTVEDIPSTSTSTETGFGY